MKSFKQFLIEENRKIVVSVPNDFITEFESINFNEGRFTKMVGKIPVHKDTPHFSGGEYHGHVDMPDGKQVTYTITGKRLHSNKFPKQVPHTVKKAIAKVLKVDPNIFESYQAYDEIEKNTVFLLELKQTKVEKVTALLEKAYSKE